MKDAFVVVPQGVIAANPYTPLAVFENSTHDLTFYSLTVQRMEICAVVPAGAAGCTEPQPILTVIQDRIHLVVYKSVQFGEIKKFVAIETTDAIIPGREPEESLAILRDVFNAYAWQSVSG